jgi:hypothetical protein
LVILVVTVLLIPLRAVLSTRHADNPTTPPTSHTPIPTPTPIASITEASIQALPLFASFPNPTHIPNSHSNYYPGFHLGGDELFEQIDRGVSNARCGPLSRSVRVGRSCCRLHSASLEDTQKLSLFLEG